LRGLLESGAKILYPEVNIIISYYSMKNNKTKKYDAPNFTHADEQLKPFVPEVVTETQEEVEKYSKMLYDIVGQIVNEVKQQFLPKLSPEDLNAIIFKSIDMIQGNDKLKEGLTKFTTDILDIFASKSEEMSQKIEKILLGMLSAIPFAGIPVAIVNTLEMVVNIFKMYGEIVLNVEDKVNNLVNIIPSIPNLNNIASLNNNKIIPQLTNTTSLPSTNIVPPKPPGQFGGGSKSLKNKHIHLPLKRKSKTFKHTNNRIKRINRSIRTLMKTNSTSTLSTFGKSGAKS